MTTEYIGALVVVAVFVAALVAFLLSRRKNKQDAPQSVTNVTTAHIPDVTFEDGAPGIVQHADTGRKAGQMKHRLECDVSFEGFLGANTGDGKEGHLVIMTRATLANIPSGNFRGIGWIAGSLWQGGGAPFGIGDFTQRGCIEDWQNGAKPSEDWPFLKPQSVTPRLEDGHSYHVIFTSEPAPGGWITRLWFGDFDSGPIPSDNINIDLSEQAVALVAIGKGRVRVMNMVSTWT